jgi:hypothetical protein
MSTKDRIHLCFDLGILLTDAKVIEIQHVVVYRNDVDFQQMELMIVEEV